MKTDIAGYLARWRHTLGFGVHSPLAYRIVKDCVRPDPRYAMYVDVYIDSIYADNRKSAERAYLLVRLINELQPRTVWLPGADGRMVETLREAFPSIPVSKSRNCPKNTDFIAIFNNTNIAAAWGMLSPEADACLVDFSRSGAAPCRDNGAPTLTLSGLRYDIYIRRKGMSHVAYTIL